MGWPFYQAAADSICKSKLALQITNRFNHDVYDDYRIYNKLMQNLTENPNVFWLPNNKYELHWLNMNGVFPPTERTFLIRPYGVSNYNPNRKVKVKKTIIYTLFITDFAREILLKSNLKNGLYELHSEQTYGGPVTLKKHKLFVYIPYQFSTMKVFQNSNYGVMMAVPTPRFYEEIILRNFTEVEYAGVCKDQVSWLIKNFPDNWPEFFDIYDPQYVDIHLQFDSWKELINIINHRNIDKIKKKFLPKISRAMKLHWMENDNKWDKFFKLSLL